MKVTFIGPGPSMKFISPYCCHLAEELSKKVELEFIGFKQIVPEGFYCGGSKQQQLILETKMKTKSRINCCNPFSWIYTGLKINGDIIHIQHWALYSNIAYCVMLPLLKLRQKKVVITIHNVTPHVPEKTFIFIDKIINKFIFSFVHTFIVHNERNKQRFFEIYSKKHKDITIIPHGIGKNDHLTSISKHAAQKKLQINLDKKIILFFGYIWRYKGIDVLLKALFEVKQQLPNVILLIAGQSLKNRESWYQYEQLISELQLKDHVIKKLHFIPDEEIPIYFSASDVVVLPYKGPFDTHGGVGELAVVYKKPLIVTDIGGLPEYVKDKRIIVPPGNAQVLAQKIIEVLKDKNFQTKLMKDALKIKEELSWELIAKRTIEVYHKCLQQSADI